MFRHFFFSDESNRLSNVFKISNVHYISCRFKCYSRFGFLVSTKYLIIGLLVDGLNVKVFNCSCGAIFLKDLLF